MRNIKRVLLKITVALTIAAVAAVSGICAVAADTSAKISVPQSVSKGDSFKITVTFSSNVNIGSVKARIDYDSDVIEFVSGEFAGGGGGLCLINGWSETIGKTSTFELTFKAVGNGTSQIVLEQASVYSDVGDLIGSPVNTSSITVKDPNAANQTTVTTKAPEQTSSATASESQAVSEETSVTTTPQVTTVSPADDPNTGSEQISAQLTDPIDDGDSEDISDADDEEDYSEEDVSSKEEDSGSKGPITAILLIVGCIAIACILMMDDGKGKKRSSSRLRKR